MAGVHQYGDFGRRAVPPCWKVASLVCDAQGEMVDVGRAWNLAVIYITENRGSAIGTSIERVSKGIDLYKRGEAFGMPCYQIDGMKIEEL